MSVKNSQKFRMAHWLLTTSIFTVFIGSTYAYNWETSLGQGGGSLSINVYVDPNDDRNVFVSGDFHSGMWKSTNSGDTWRQINKGLRAMWNWSVAVTPGNSNIVYTGTRMGPHKSTDGGLTWVLKRNGMPDATDSSLSITTAPVNGIYVHPTNVNIIYACVGNSVGDDRIFLGGANNPANNGLWISTDAAENWQKVTSFPAVPTNTVAFNEQNPDIIWVGAGGDTNNVNNAGVFKSTDAGVHWTRVSNGLPNITAKRGPAIFKIVLHPTNPDIAYTLISGQTRDLPFLFMTTNGGANWADRGNGIFNQSDVKYPWRALAMHPKKPNILYCGAHYTGVFKSTDAGATWVRKTGDNEPTDNYFSYRNLLDLENFLDWEGCIWWGNMNLAVGKQRGVLFTTNISSICRSYDEGETWTSPSTKAMNNPDNGYYRSTGYATYYLKQIAFDPTDPKYVYCMNWDSERLLKSEDGGMHWKYSMVGCRNEHMAPSRADVAVDPDDGRVVYYVEKGREVGSFYRSTNHGDTWEERRPLNAADCCQIGLAPGGTVTARTIYVVADSGGLFKTTNSGTSWTQIDTSLGIYRIAVDPKNANIVYAGARRGKLRKTTNGGTAWDTIRAGVIPTKSNFLISSIAINPYNSQNVFVGGFLPGNCFRTTNGGASWNVVWNKNIRQGSQVNALAFDPHDSTGKTIFLSDIIWGSNCDNDDIPGNPFMSTDGGTNWVAVGEGVDQYHGSVLAVSPHKRILWYGSQGSGMARVSIPHLLGQDPNWKGELDLLKEQATSVQPIVATTGKTNLKTLRFDASARMLWVPVNGRSTIEVFNASGKRIILSQTENGVYSAQLKMNGLASGMCVVRVTTSQGSKVYRFAAIR